MTNWMFKRNFWGILYVNNKKVIKKKPVESAVTKEQLKAIKTFQENLVISLYVSSGQNIELPWCLIWKILLEYGTAILSPEENLCSSDLTTYLWRVIFCFCCCSQWMHCACWLFWMKCISQIVNSNRNAFQLGLWWCHVDSTKVALWK